MTKTDTRTVAVRTAHDLPIDRGSHRTYKRQDTPHRSATKEVTISFYEHEVPEFLEPELDRMYQSPYSTLARLRIYQEDKNLKVYAALQGAAVISVLMFRLEGRKVVVLNQQTQIDAAEITRFATAVFARYPSVTAISFWGLMPSPGQLPFLSHQNFCLPEVVLTLPESPDAYLASLGSKTRGNIRRCLKKLSQTYPSFRTQTSVKGDINPQDISDIIQLSNARMAVKGNVTYNSDEETQRLVRLAGAYGLVFTIKIDDRIGAGVVCYRVGSTYFGQVLAHDPKFDEYKLGLVCNYLSISEFITRGGRELRMGGSTHSYKFDLRGKLMHLDYLIVYRNLAHYVAGAPSALMKSIMAYLSRAKLWLLLAQRRDDWVSRVTTRIINRVREFKRTGFAMGAIQSDVANIPLWPLEVFC
jgi:hypothetical protein